MNKHTKTRFWAFKIFFTYFKALLIILNAIQFEKREANKVYSNDYFVEI